MNTVFNLICAIIIFLSIAWRLAKLAPYGRCLRSRATNAAWVVSHVLIGVGAFSVIVGPLSEPVPAEVLINAGLALYFGVRWHRRSDDRKKERPCAPST